MAHFYGTLRGSRGEVARCGTKNSGLAACAASHHGAIDVQLCHDPYTGEDCFEIRQITWQGAGIYEPIARGVLGKPQPQTREEL